MLKTLREVGENRLELFLLEVQEERVRLFDALILIAIGIVCVTMALIMITFTLVVIFWDTHRLLVLALAIAVYVIAALVALRKLRSNLQHSQPFSATLEELKKDRACFKKPD